MRFTDDRERLDIRVREGNVPDVDPTPDYFGHAPEPDGMRHVGDVRALLDDVLDMIHGRHGHDVPEFDTSVEYAITDMDGRSVASGVERTSDADDVLYCGGCGRLLTEENANPCGDVGWCDECY